jgi:Iap family predicted aminopeptidase
MFSVTAKHTMSEVKLANVVGVLPGKSLKNEYVIFSGHYDHLGISSRNMVNNDSIYNGANDDAAGTTAVMMLAKYFKALNNNERTLIFVAFTGEETGGFGAQYFSKQFNPEKVKAMFNIEMIGTESKWGKNSAYITGYEKTIWARYCRPILKAPGLHFIPIPILPKTCFTVLITPRSQGLVFRRIPSPLPKWTANPITTKPAMRSAHSTWRTWP